MQDNQPEQFTKPITPPVTSTPDKSEAEGPTPTTIILSLTTSLFFILTIFFGIQTFTRKTPECPTCAKNESREEIIEGISASLGFYQDKITNAVKDAEYRVSVHRANPEGNSAFGAFISNDNESIEAYVYWEYVSSVYGLEVERTDRETFLISGFNAKIADLIIAEIGQDASGDILLILFQDGSIGYMPVKKALENRDLRSYGKVGGLDDVSKFYNAVVVGEDIDGYSTTLAQRIDGSIVDLQDLLKAVLD